MAVILRIADAGADAETTRDPEALAALEIPLPDGGVAPLSALAELRLEAKPARIARADQRRVFDVELRLADPSARVAVERAIAAGLELPPGVVVAFE